MEDRDRPEAARFEARARVAMSSVDVAAKPWSMKAAKAASRMRRRTGISVVVSARGLA